MIIPEDKFMHALVSTVSSFLVSMCFMFMKFQCLIVGSMFTLGLGLGKEYGDSKATGNHWCCWDLLADVIGIVIGCGIALLLLEIRYHE